MFCWYVWYLCLRVNQLIFQIHLICMIKQWRCIWACLVVCKGFFLFFFDNFLLERVNMSVSRWSAHNKVCRCDMAWWTIILQLIHVDTRSLTGLASSDHAIVLTASTMRLVPKSLTNTFWVGLKSGMSHINMYHLWKNGFSLIFTKLVS